MEFEETLLKIEKEERGSKKDPHLHAHERD
jgi:hypothetical protein